MNFITALFLTIIIETFTAILFGYKKQRELLAVAIVSMVTNPALNLFIATVYYLKFINISIGLILFLELTVVIIEWRMLKKMLRKNSNELLLLSFAMNSASFMAGLLISYPALNQGGTI